MRRLFATRQPLIGFLVVFELANAFFLGLIAWSVDGLGSFSRLARDVFLQNPPIQRAFDSLESPRVGPIAALLAFVFVSALVIGWLRACFILSLVGEHVTFRPPRRIVLRLTAYGVLINLLALAGSELGAGGLLLALLLAPPTLYADYAIAVDDVDLITGLTRSVAVVRATLALSAGLWILLEVLIPATVQAIFDSGFEDKTYVEPTYLVAYLVVLALVQFLIDISLVTVYRATPLRAKPAADED
jgi:hypothetical protein